jgi:hypothetical protein
MRSKSPSWPYGSSELCVVAVLLPKPISLPLPFPLGYDEAATSGRAGTGGVDVLPAPVLVDTEGALLRWNVLSDGPRGVTKCRLDEALSAGESGRYFGLAVRMNVCSSAKLS